jgi:HEAT repeat protein
MNLRSTTKTLALAAAAMLAAALAAWAGDGDKPKDAPPAAPKPVDTRPVSSDEAGKAAIARFERDFGTTDQGRRMNAIQSLSQTKNNLVTKKLATLLGNADSEVRQAAAMCLDGMYQDPDLAGELLRKGLSKEKDPDVLGTMVSSIGKLFHAKALDDLGEILLNNGVVWVKIDCLRAMRRINDKRALLLILELWLKEPHGYSWEGGEVTVDTGAPGDTDQKAAEAAYKAKYGNQGRKGAPPTLIKTYAQEIAETVKALTGEKISNPTELMQWLCKNEATLGFPLPAMVKTKMKEWEERSAKRKSGKDAK